MQQPPGGAATGETPDPDAIVRMCADHARWLESDGAEGVRADLSGMELADVRFPGADLRRAVFAQAPTSSAPTSRAPSFPRPTFRAPT